MLSNYEQYIKAAYIRPTRFLLRPRLINILPDVQCFYEYSKEQVVTMTISFLCINETHHVDFCCWLDGWLKQTEEVKYPTFSHQQTETSMSEDIAELTSSELAKTTSKNSSPDWSFAASGDNTSHNVWPEPAKTVETEPSGSVTLKHSAPFWLCKKNLTFLRSWFYWSFS